MGRKRTASSGRSSGHEAREDPLTPEVLRVLDFPAVLEGVASAAASLPGREAIRARSPGFDPAAIRAELARVAEMAAFLEAHPDWIPMDVADARPALVRLAVDGVVLDPHELWRLSELLRTARELRVALTPRVALFPVLQSYLPLLYDGGAIEGEITRSVDADGQVLDSASPDLRRIRSTLRRARARIVARLETFLKGLPERWRVPDASVSVREGRYVVPIRREGKGEIGGIIHGESATGATLFVEPPLALGLMAELGELEREEQREIARILRDLTRRLVPVRPFLLESQAAQIDFDSLFGRGRMAQRWGSALPEILPPGAEEIRIVRGRHPLLLLRADHPVVPFDLELEPGERCLVVSGPNTGGKSVLLKAMGLLPMMAQSGILPPVGPGSVLPVFEAVHADIGDGQSIAESLSTFSAHLMRLREILEQAGRSSLVLIDEMGTGTDPREGAALARAILEELVARGAHTVATSHLGELKRLDVPGSGIVNASLQFDPDRIEPTYALVKGRPGRSYGLAIARRLGLPEGVLSNAAGFLTGAEVSVEELLEQLERREKETAARMQALERDRAAAESLRRAAEEREAALRERERGAEARAREEARRMLLEAREEVERAIAEVRGAQAEELEEKARIARRQVEEAARRQREAARGGRAERTRGGKGAGKGAGGAGKGVAPRAPASGVALQVGDRVRLRKGGATGTLVELRDDRGVVESQGMRLQLRVGELVRADDAAASGDLRGERSSSAMGGGLAGTAPSGAGVAPPPRRGGTVSIPEVEPRWEVHLRGMRMEEMEIELERALDAAVLGDLPELRVVHGKGTGALRARVHEILAADRRVRSYRAGLVGEGGHGVTVARLA